MSEKVIIELPKTLEELFSLFESHMKATRVLTEKESSPQEPYKFKYEGREHLLALLLVLEKYDGESDIEEVNRMTHLIEYELGVNYIETEENHQGEVHLDKCISFLESNSEKYSYELQDTYNTLGILWSVRSEMEKAVEFLGKAESLYLEMARKASGENKGWTGIENIDNAYTMTVFYLAQVYGHLNKKDESAKYCLKTLVRQFKQGDFEKKEWVDNCIFLSGYYLSIDKFKECEQILKAATKIIPDDVEEVTKANLFLAWGKFRLFLLKNSRNRLLERNEQQNSNLALASEELRKAFSEENDTVGEDDGDEVLDDLNPNDADILMQLTDLNLDPVNEVKLITKFEDAREVFKLAVSDFHNSLQMYVLDGYVSDHVSIVQDISLLYKVLATFESDRERQAAMHKRRANRLEPVLKAISMDHYLVLYRQMSFELGEIYTEIMELRTANADEPRKINAAIARAVQYFQIFISSYKDRSGKMPDVFPDDGEIPSLLAYFHLARLHSKFVSDKLPVQIEHLKRSLQEYEHVTKYKNREKVGFLQGEFEIADEMARLLPIKLDHMLALWSASFQEKENT